MKAIFLAATLTLFSTAAFAESCSDRYAACQRPRGGGACEADCQKTCNAQRANCMKTGTFNTRNTSRTGLEKR